MKHKLLLLLFMLATQAGIAQSSTRSLVGFGSAVSGNGDLPGHSFLLGSQRYYSRFATFEVIATGTWTQALYRFAPGYEIKEESKGVSLDAVYAPQLISGRFSFYPAIGPSVRFAHERYVKSASVWQSNGTVIEFEADVQDENQMQLGAVLSLNADARITNKYSFGIRAAMYRYHTGQALALVNFTLRKTGWWF